jgi:hypothetical protein
MPEENVSRDHDYTPYLSLLQRDLIDQLRAELEHERSCKLALLATVYELQHALHLVCMEEK